MLKGIDEFIRNIEDGNWLVVGAVGLTLVISIYRTLYSLYAEIKERKNNDLKSALEIDGLSDDVRYVVLESLNRTYFYRATGLASDQFTRTRLRQFLESTKGEISIYGIYRARKYIDVIDQKLVVIIRKIDVFDCYWQMLTSFVLVVLSLYLVAITFVEKDIAFVQHIAFYAFSGFMIVFCILSLRMVAAFHIAKSKIKPAFERFEKQQKKNDGVCQSGVTVDCVESDGQLEGNDSTEPLALVGSNGND